jgi:hypothetical protein
MQFVDPRPGLDHNHEGTAVRTTFRSRSGLLDRSGGTHDTGNRPDRRRPEPPLLPGAGEPTPCDGGAVLVEAAVALPVFVVLVLGIIEFGLAFKDYLTASNMTRTGARVASAAANDALADQRTLAALARASAAVSRGSIERIVVYRADSVDTPVPAVCTTSATGVASGPVRCNVYRVADLDRPATDFGCQPTSPDRYWCPRDRKVAQAGPNGPPDLVGVWVRLRHHYVSGLVGDSVELDSTTVMRVEPRRRR